MGSFLLDSLCTPVPVEQVSVVLKFFDYCGKIEETWTSDRLGIAGVQQQ